jgi:hypothetical protein
LLDCNIAGVELQCSAVLQVWQYYLLPPEEQRMPGVKNPMCHVFPRIGIALDFMPRFITDFMADFIAVFIVDFMADFIADSITNFMADFILSPTSHLAQMWDAKSRLHQAKFQANILHHIEFPM